MPRELGTVAGSETLIRELYIDLRKSIHEWAALTKQTAQARMGYIGQHLVSVVTGYKGGRSGARGHDLEIPGHGFGEIKTCYRVDQLGKCQTCGAAVASIELECPTCNSKDIKRNDDSKWLITMSHEKDFEEILDPYRYYLVLFDFVDLQKPESIRALIWEVDPISPGFALCMIDYWYNIKAKSKSKAPFNLWPYSPKFDIMRPLLIYEAHINLEGIETITFPGRDEPRRHPLPPLAQYARTRNLSPAGLKYVMEKLEFKAVSSKQKRAELLSELDRHILSGGIASDTLTDALVHGLYDEPLRRILPNLPQPLKVRLGEIGSS